ncbi:MAG: ester cyclase [Microcystaceae cyanobacterium]
MSATNIATAMKFYEIYNAHKLELIDEIFTSEYVGHVNAHNIEGAEAAKGFIGGYLQGIPDSLYTVLDTLTCDNKVIVRWVTTGTHTGNFFGMEPTNRAINVTGITIFEIVDNKINQLWNNWDQFTFVQQLKGE